MRADIVPGAVFPDFELPADQRRKLSELQVSGRVFTQMAGLARSWSITVAAS